jgi:hypothetical protein
VSVPSEAELLALARGASGETGLARATWRREKKGSVPEFSVEVVAIDSPVAYAPARGHDGWDLAAFAAGAEVPAALSVFAWASGEHATERRSHVRAQRGELARAATRTDARHRLQAELDGLPDHDAGADLDDAVVLGPDAVAQVLEALRKDLQTLESRRGTRVASSAVNLSDSPRFTATLAQSLTLQGVPRAPSPVIQDGVSAGRPQQSPEHLVLVGGGAADLAELTRGGEIPFVTHLDRVPDPFALLARVQALTARQSTIPRGSDPAAVTATVCPAIRLGPA